MLSYITETSKLWHISNSFWRRRTLIRIIFKRLIICMDFTESTVLNMWFLQHNLWFQQGRPLFIYLWFSFRRFISSNYTTTIDNMMSEWCFENDVEGRDQGYLRYYSGICLAGLSKTTTSSIRIASLRA